MFVFPLNCLNQIDVSNLLKKSFLKWRKRQQSQEPKEYHSAEEQPQGEEHEEGMGSPNGGVEHHEPNAQSWQPMQGMNFSKSEGGAAEEGQTPTDNKAKAMDLAKKGWAMYKDHKNKG
jgi:hypothetical protein